MFWQNDTVLGYGVHPVVSSGEKLQYRLVHSEEIGGRKTIYHKVHLLSSAMNCVHSFQEATSI